MDQVFTSFKAPGFDGVILRTGSDCLFDPVSLLDIPDDPALCCKKGVTVQAGKNGKWFVKRFCHRTLLKAAAHLFKISRPLNCLRAAEGLDKAGIDTPQVAAALRKYRGLLPEFDYLITVDINGKAVFADKMPLTVELADDLTALLVKMHNAGIEHGDVNLRNIYRSVSGEWGVIDLDSCRIFKQALGIRRRRRELARLASSFIKIAVKRGETDMREREAALLFLKLYHERSGIDLDAGAYWKRVVYLTGRKRR